MITIRDARPDEALALEALQRRSSDVWEDDRANLAAHPDAIEPPHQAIADRRVRVAVDAAGRRVGFSVVLPVVDGRCELGATFVDVIANPNALGFYERVGFVTIGEAATRFGDAPRMTLELDGS